MFEKCLTGTVWRMACFSPEMGHLWSSAGCGKRRVLLTRTVLVSDPLVSIIIAGQGYHDAYTP